MASYVELTIDQNTTFTSTFDLANDDGTAMDVTNYTFKSEIRKSYYSTNPTANLQITAIDSANGHLLIRAEATETQNVKPGRYLYDVKMTKDNGDIIRVIEGIVTITPSVSK